MNHETRSKCVCYLYNLGGAHAVSNVSEENFVKFIGSLLLKDEYKVFYGFTNNNQTVARNHLQTCGFTSKNITNSLMVHYAKTEEISKAIGVPLKDIEEKKKVRAAALALRPRDASGRLLNRDGTIKRKPYEYFVGDEISWHRWTKASGSYTSHTGRVRVVNADGTLQTFRNTINPRITDVTLQKRAK